MYCDCVIQLHDILEKDLSMETVGKDFRCQGFGMRERGREEQGSTEDLRAVKLLCVIQW